MIRQRLYGLGLLAIALLLPLLCDGDATASVALAPLGLWMLCSRQYLLYDSERSETHGKNR